MRLRPLLVLALAAAGPSACGDATAPTAAAQLAHPAVLPTDPAYITGTVVALGRRLGTEPSALVATDPRDPLAGRSAHVVLGPELRVVHRDGRRADVAEVRPGRVVTAWVGPTELRSLPPVVVGRVLVIER